MNKKFLGLAGSLSLALILSFMGVVSRHLTEFSLLQQVYGRVGIAALIIAIIYRQELQPKAFGQIPKHDIYLSIARGIIYYSGVVAVSYGILTTDLFVVAILSSLPFASIFGITLLKEKLTLTRLACLVFSLLGVVIMQNITQLKITFSFGELSAILSGFLFAVAYVSRRKHSQTISNKQISSIMIFSAFLSLMLASWILDGEFIAFTNISSTTWLWLLLGGIFNILVIGLTNYSFSQLPAVVVDIILKLSAVGSLIFGLVLYSESLTILK